MTSKTDPDDLVMNDPDREVVRGNERRSMVWILSPAQLQLLSVARRRLLKVAELRGMKVEQVHKVRAALRKSKKQLFVYPVPETDPDGIEVKAYGKSSTVWVNLISLLGGTSLVAPTGFRDRYQVVMAGEDQSPVGPALQINLARRLERRVKAGKAEPPPTDQAASGAKPRGDAKQPAS